MFVALLSHVLCAAVAFAIPAYATYKALANPHDLDTLRALAAYWAVLGAFIAVEQSLGLFLSWLPFYWELRTLFLLYISLPQTQGSARVYNTFLAPWFQKHEADLDLALASAQSNAIAFCRSRIAALLDFVRRFLDNTPPTGDSQQPAYPSLKGLWAAYGPSVMATFAPKDASDARDKVHQPYAVN